MLNKIVADMVATVGMVLLSMLALCWMAIYCMLYTARVVVIGCLYAVAVCIFPFYWSYNALFKSRS